MPHCSVRLTLPVFSHSRAMTLDLYKRSLPSGTGQEQEGGRGAPASHQPIRVSTGPLIFLSKYGMIIILYGENHDHGSLFFCLLLLANTFPGVVRLLPAWVRQRRCCVVAYRQQGVPIRGSSGRDPRIGTPCMAHIPLLRA